MKAEIKSNKETEVPLLLSLLLPYSAPHLSQCKPIAFQPFPHARCLLWVSPGTLLWPVQVVLLMPSQPVPRMLIKNTTQLPGGFYLALWFKCIHHERRSCMATGEAHSFLLKVETKTPAGFNPEKLNGGNSEQRAPVISLSQLKVASPHDATNYAAQAKACWRGADSKRITVILAQPIH